MIHGALWVCRIYLTKALFKYLATKPIKRCLVTKHAKVVLSGQMLLLRHSLHTVAVPAVQAAVKTELSYPENKITALQLTKTKKVLKLLWHLLIVNWRILGLI